MRKTLLCIAVSCVLLCVGVQGAFADVDKTLYFSSADGKLYYDSKNSSSVNSFMVFEQMASQTTYRDQLVIRNDTQEDYGVYFQVVPKNGSTPLSSKLLEEIVMRISCEGELLYEGSADAITKTGGIDVAHMAFVGRFSPRDTKTLHVEITLLHDEALKTVGRYFTKSEYLVWESVNFDERLEPPSYSTQEEAQGAAGTKGDAAIIYYEDSSPDSANLNSLWGAFAETSWEFYGQSEEGIQPMLPLTGDNTPINNLIIAGIVALGIVVIIVVSRRFSKTNNPTK